MKPSFLVLATLLVWLVTDGRSSGVTPVGALAGFGSEIHEVDGDAPNLSPAGASGRAASGRGVSQPPRLLSRVASSRMAGSFSGTDTSSALARPSSPHPRLRLIRPAP